MKMLIARFVWLCMARVKIDGCEAVRDIREGMNDITLMKKYGLSAKGLHSLYSQLIKAGALSSSDVGPHFKMEVPAREVVADIRTGMTRADLAAKYRLSSKGLASLLSKLVRARVVRKSEIERLIMPAKAKTDKIPATQTNDFDHWAASFEENIDQGWKKKEPDLM